MTLRIISAILIGISLVALGFLRKPRKIEVIDLTNMFEIN